MQDTSKLAMNQCANVSASPVCQSPEGLTDLIKTVGDSKYDYSRDFKGNFWTELDGLANWKRPFRTRSTPEENSTDQRQ
jgi:hypothetical protein